MFTSLSSVICSFSILWQPLLSSLSVVVSCLEVLSASISAVQSQCVCILYCVEHCQVTCKKMHWHMHYISVIQADMFWSHVGHSLHSYCIDSISRDSHRVHLVCLQTGWLLCRQIYTDIVPHRGHALSTCRGEFSEGSRSSSEKGSASIRLVCRWLVNTICSSWVAVSISCRYSRLMELCYRRFNCRKILNIPVMLCSCLPVNLWSVIGTDHYIPSV